MTTPTSKDENKLNRLRTLAKELGLETGIEALLEAQSRSAQSLPAFLQRAALDDTQEVLSRLGGRSTSRPQEEGRNPLVGQVPPQLLERIKRLAIVRDCPVAEILEDALLQYLGEQEGRFKA